jgi:hypothetical protein
MSIVLNGKASFTKVKIMQLHWFMLNRFFFIDTIIIYTKSITNNMEI